MLEDRFGSDSCCIIQHEINLIDSTRTQTSVWTRNPDRSSLPRTKICELELGLKVRLGLKSEHGLYSLDFDSTPLSGVLSELFAVYTQTWLKVEFVGLRLGQDLGLLIHDFDSSLLVVSWIELANNSYCFVLARFAENRINKNHIFESSSSGLAPRLYKRTPCPVLWMNMYFSYNCEESTVTDEWNEESHIFNPLTPIGSPVTHENWPMNWPNFAASPALLGWPARNRHTAACIHRFSHILRWPPEPVVWFMSESRAVANEHEGHKRTLPIISSSFWMTVGLKGLSHFCMTCFAISAEN